MPRLALVSVVIGLVATACSADGPISVDEPASSEEPAPVAGPGAIPPVDVTQAAVPLDEIVFDTFDGGSVTLAEADSATIERLR